MLDAIVKPNPPAENAFLEGVEEVVGVGFWRSHLAERFVPEAHALLDAVELRRNTGGRDQRCALLDANELSVAEQRARDAELTGSGADVDDRLDIELIEPARGASNRDQRGPILSGGNAQAFRQESIEVSIVRTASGLERARDLHR